VFCGGPATAMDCWEREHFEVLLTDFRLPNEDGMNSSRARSRCRGPGVHFDDGLRSKNWPCRR